LRGPWQNRQRGGGETTERNTSDKTRSEDQEEKESLDGRNTPTAKAVGEKRDHKKTWRKKVRHQKERGEEEVLRSRKKTFKKEKTGYTWGTATRG